MNKYTFTYLNRSVIVHAGKLTKAMAKAEEQLQPSGYGCWQTKSTSQKDSRNFKWVPGNFGLTDFYKDH